MHLPDERRLALDLLDGDRTKGLKTHGFETGSDFLELAECFSIVPRRAETELTRFEKSGDRVAKLIEASFLTEEAKGDYHARYEDRLRAIRIRH